MRPALFTLVVATGLAGCGGCERPKTPPAVANAAPRTPEEERGHAVQALLASPWIESALAPASDTQPSPALVLITPQPLAGPALLAFGQQVKVLTPREAQTQRPETYLELTAIRLEGDRAAIAFRDESEGVSGEAQLTRAPEGWKVDRVTGTQH